MAQMEMFPAAANSPATELTAAITDVQTTVSVLDASKLPDAPNIATIGVDESAETVRYEGKSGNDLTGVTRGFSGTTAKAWATGVGVARYFTAYDADALRENVADVNAQLADIVTVNVKTLGAKGDGLTNDTHAFRLAAQRIKELNGGKLVIPSGTYIVGEQTFANGYGKGYAYESAKIIEITDCDYVEIVGNNAILKIDPTLKYGSYDPTTGDAYSAILPFYDTNYQAQIGDIIRLKNNKVVKVRGIELNGNNTEVMIGGKWGDAGTQIKASGIVLDTNGCVFLENVISHHQCLDGLLNVFDYNVGGVSAFMTMTNCAFDYNGRQGFSWVGGSNITATSCRFNHTGRAGIGSEPQAGLDIEPTTEAHNGVFINCEFADNVGIGMVSDNQPNVSNIAFTNCRFYGTTNFPIYPNGKAFKFYNCTISGEASSAYHALKDEEKTLFRDCFFTGDATYNGRPIFGTSVVNFWDVQNPILENCTIVSNNSGMKVGNTGENTTIKDCSFLQNGSFGTAFLRGIYRGYNKVKIVTGANDPASMAYNYGTLEYIDASGIVTQVPPVSNTIYTKNILGNWFAKNLLIPLQSTITNWEIRITFSNQYEVYYCLDVTAVGYFANDNKRGIHKNLYSGDTLSSENNTIVEHQVGISGFALGLDTTSSGNTLIIPITHTTGSAVSLHVKGTSMLDCLNLELVQVV